MATPEETIIPFADLPDCATDCGPLFDANGACVPPITSEVDEACFCNHDAVAGFKTGTEGVCDDACDAQEALVAIQNWFAETCDVEKAGASDGGDDDDSAGSSGSGSSPSRTLNQGTGKSWVEMHWRWLVMIIVLAVAIIVIWVGAFWWRRRYLRKKELKRSLGKNPATPTTSWGPGAAPAEAEAGGVFSKDKNNSSSDSAGLPEKPGRSWWGGKKAG